MGTVTDYLALLAATLAIEAPLAALLAGRARRREALLAALALNLLSHPLAFAARWLAGARWLPVELSVALTEALGYRLLAGLSWRRAGALSLRANLLSALAAVALTST